MTANAVVNRWGVKPFNHPYVETPERLIELVSTNQEIVTLVNDLDFPCELSGTYTIEYPPKDNHWYKAHVYIHGRCGSCNVCGESKNNPLHNGVDAIPTSPWKATIRYKRVDADVLPQFKGTSFDYVITEVLEVTRGN